MKYSHLKQLIEVFSHYTKIKRAKRVGDNQILVDFYDQCWVFDVTRSNGLIFPREIEKKYTKYNSPFDLFLEKITNKATLLRTQLLNEDKLFSLELEQIGKYKKEKRTLIFELTGKHTNVVVVENKKVVSALHLIGANLSSREIRIGKEYTFPPKPNFAFKEDYQRDIKEYLRDLGERREREKLDAFKKVKIANLDRKIYKLQQEINGLQDPAEHLLNAHKYAKDAETIFINISNIKGYEKELILKDGEDKERLITFLPLKTPSQIGNYYYARSKRERSKAENLHLEKDALEERISFFKTVKKRIVEAESKASIELLFPPKKKGKEKKENSNVILTFIEDFKVFVGVNERGNIKVLKEAKADDYWFHVREIPSSHLIVRGDKKRLKEEIIQEAAKLCALFSTDKKDKFSVDYAQRKFVKIQERANVLYNQYKTVIVDLKD